MEDWEPIHLKGLSKYEVSNKGRVRNKKTGRILKGTPDRNGDLVVCLREKGVQYSVRVKKLVAEAFLNSSNLEYPVLSCKDGNRKNLKPNNLEYISTAESVRRTFRKGRKQKHIMKKIKCVETGDEYESIVECSKRMGISVQAISRSVNNPFLSTKDGYHFEALH